MANPLSKRFPRELRNNIGKYLGLFFMLVVAVAFTGGYLLAAGSIENILVGMDEKYEVEDGRFICDFEASDEAIDAVEALGVTVYPDFYRQVPLEIGDTAGGSGGKNSAASGEQTEEATGDAASETAPTETTEATPEITARIYANRTELNLAAYEQGRAPEAADEIALDRVFMSNHNLAVGDTVTIDGHAVAIVGICTLPDYQALFRNNTDFVHDAITFTVGQMTPDGLRALHPNSEVYSYSFVFTDQTLDFAARTDIEEDMVDALVDHDAAVADFIDAEDNQGIGFALDDVQADRTVFTIVLYMLIVIMAFVFTVLTGATIESESAVIGTMLASGWRKSELIRHYLTLPAIVGLVAVLVGLVLGVTLLSEPLRGLYYNSYGIPPYELHWDLSIVFATTVLPYAILMGITFVGLARKLRFTPLQFLRHEAVSRKRHANVSLPDRLSYATRFRLRVLLRNASHFVTLFFGIAFASLLLLFATCLLPVMQNYATELRKTVASPYQYVLKVPLELESTPEQREMYAAALRLIEDHERTQANQDAVDAAERLADNAEVMDALELLADDQELLDVFNRVQDSDSPSFDDLRYLMNLDADKQDAIEVLQDADDAVKDDLDLVRTIDKDLLDDLILANDIDEDANLINSQENSADVIAQVEKYATGSIEIKRAATDKAETVTIYGIQPNSRYWSDIPVEDGVMYSGAGLVEKTIAEVGEPCEAVNRRQGETYTITVAGTTDNEADVSLYCTLHDFNELFGNEADYFNGYASAEPIVLDERYLARIVTPEDMDKIAAQMEDSFSDFAQMMMVLAVPIYLILIYLLTKTVIDRSARSISYLKVFGYRNREVNGLYVRPITYWVLFSLVASLPLIYGAILGLMKFAFSRFAGNFPLIVPSERMALIVVVGMVAYAIIAFIHVRRVKRVPLELAMKVQE